MIVETVSRERLTTSRLCVKALIPVGRLGQPAEIAAIVEMLVTNAYMTNKVRPCAPAMPCSSVSDVVQ